MSLSRWRPLWLASAFFLWPFLVRAGDIPASVDFNRQIRPILSESCYQCHGPDVNKRKADLRLDLRDGLFQSAEGTTIVVPGKPEESELFTRITSDDSDLRMPPPKIRRATRSRTDRPDQTLDCRRSPVERPLGLYSAYATRRSAHARPSRSYQ